MPLTSPQKVIEHTGFPQSLVEKIARHIAMAETWMRKIIGDTTYDDLSTRHKADPDRQRATRAESLLSVYFAMPVLNLRPTDRGGFVKATGIDQGPNQSRNELMGINEMERYRYKIYRQAMELIEDMILQEDDDLEGPVKMSAI